MKNCYHCKYCNHTIWRNNIYCGKNDLPIPHPHLMGGPKKCECYEPEFTYPRRKEK